MQLVYITLCAIQVALQHETTFGFFLTFILNMKKTQWANIQAVPTKKKLPCCQQFSVIVDVPQQLKMRQSFILEIKVTLRFSNLFSYFVCVIDHLIKI